MNTSASSLYGKITGTQGLDMYPTFALSWDLMMLYLVLCAYVLNLYGSYLIWEL